MWRLASTLLHDSFPIVIWVDDYPKVIIYSNLRTSLEFATSELFLINNNSAGHDSLLLKENNNQEKILIPVGTAIIIVAAVK
jgi:hypothetical protein